MPEDLVPETPKPLPAAAREFLAKHEPTLAMYWDTFDDESMKETRKVPRRKLERTNPAALILRERGAKQAYSDFLVALEAMADGNEPDGFALKAGFHIVCAFTGSGLRDLNLTSEVLEKMRKEREDGKRSGAEVDAMANAHARTETYCNGALALQSELIALMKHAGVDTRSPRRAGGRG